MDKVQTLAQASMLANYLADITFFCSGVEKNNNDA